MQINRGNMGKNEKKLTHTVSVNLVTRGNNKFFTSTIQIDVLTQTCYVSTREEDPEDGFQRVLDRKRALEIAAYVDKGKVWLFQIVLSCQHKATQIWSIQVNEGLLPSSSYLKLF